MERYIEELEKYYNNIPTALQPEVRAFLDEYYQKKDTHSASNLGGLSDKELEKLLYITIKDEYLKVLPAQLSKCKNVKILIIDAPIQDIRVIDNFVDLRVLSIWGTNISENENALFNFKNILYLDIFHNDSKLDFHSSISNLPKLLICHMDNFFKESIKNFPYNIPNIISIYFSSGSIQTLPNFNHYAHLIELNVYNHQIQEIPPSIGQLKNLRALSLGANQIETIPNELFQLIQLETLVLFANKIEYLPNELFQLTQLKSLWFSSNRIKHFPSEVFSLNLKEIGFLKNPYESPLYIKQFKAVLKDIVIDDELPLFNYLKEQNKPTQESDYNYFTLKIPKTLQTPMLQYIEFFKDYVEATKGKDIIFDIKRDQQGLVLITNGNANVTLPELGAYFQEYVALTQQQSDDWIFNFEQRTTALQADIFRLKMENQVAHLKNSFKMAKLENIHLSNQLSDKKAENDFLKELSQSLSFKIDLLLTNDTAKMLNVDQLLLDIVDQATKMLERKHSRLIEDLHNDILTDFLRQQDYYATDQTRSGRTTLGVGELDIMIRKKNGTPFSIIEAFRLNHCGENNKTVAAHLDKLLHDYDTAGHERNFAIIYAEAKNFERLWQNYKTYVSELNGKPNFRLTYPLISFKEKEGISKKASIKIGIAKHRREGTIVEVYHVFINMFV